MRELGLGTKDGLCTELRGISLSNRLSAAATGVTGFLNRRSEVRMLSVTPSYSDESKHLWWERNTGCCATKLEQRSG